MSDDLLTPDEVDGMVGEIRDALRAKDLRAAREIERDIWETTLRAISNGMWDQRDLASSALRTLSYDFPRE